MIIMELKGGSWVGDMYQKFEDMCVEVEEVMYEDTFKYVENQVRTVGENVKKFYSDIMQDLLPPSPSNPVKEEDAFSLVSNHSEVKITKKPISTDDNLNNTISCSPIFSVIKPCRPMSIYSNEEKSCKENSWRQNKEINLSNQARYEAKHPNSSKDFEDKCVSNLPSIDKRSVTNTSCGLAFIETRNRSDELTSVNEVDLSKEVRATSQTEDDGGGDVDKVKKMRNPSSGPMTTDLNGHSSTDLHQKSTPFLAANHRKREDDEGFVVRQVELGEYCVLVEKNNSFSKSNLQNVQKSYKKKIRDVLSPRQWSKSKRDQEELSDWYNQQSGKSSVSSTNMMQEELRQSLMSGSFESDWELL